MSVLILTGPPASGKNAVAEALGRRLPGCAVIDVDSVRRMVVSPEVQSWEKELATSHHNLGIRNTCALVRNFQDQGLDIVITDVLNEDRASVYREFLADLDVRIVMLMPSRDEINSRLLSRPDYLSLGETEWLYDQQAAFTRFDQRIDNTMLTADEVAAEMLTHWVPSHV